MNTSKSDSEVQFSEDEPLEIDQSRQSAATNQSAILFSYPFEYMNANYPPNELPNPSSSFCAFCGRFLSNNMETSFPCKGSCRSISNGFSTADQIISQHIGPMPHRRTQPLCTD